MSTETDLYGYMSFLINRLPGEFEPIASRSGMNGSLVIKLIGQHIGNVLAKRLSSKNTEGALEELSSLWERLNAGTLHLEKKQPLTLSLRGCQGCTSDQPLGISLACSLRASIVETVLDQCVGVGHAVRWREGSGASTPGLYDCLFEVQTV